MKNLVARLALFAALTFTAAAAPITLTFDNSIISGAPGAILLVSASATNTTAILQNLNGINFNLDLPFLSPDIDDSYFLTQWPLALQPNEVLASTPLFAVTIPLAASQGQYAISVNILGGPDPSDQNILNDVATLTVDVTPTAGIPEPTTLALTFGALATTAFLRRRRNA